MPRLRRLIRITVAIVIIALLFNALEYYFIRVLTGENEKRERAESSAESFGTLVLQYSVNLLVLNDEKKTRSQKSPQSRSKPDLEAHFTEEYVQLNKITQ